MRVVQEELEQEPRLLPYQAFATGTGLDEDGPYTGLAIIHDDSDAARRNEGRLAERIRKGTSLGGGRWAEIIPDFDITSQDRVVLATLRGNTSTLWQSFYLADPLLLH